MARNHEEVLEYWLQELQPEDWYIQKDAVDQTIRERFEPWLADVKANTLGRWKCTTRGMLAYIILTDQFTRNIYRNDPRAYAYDGYALSMAQRAIQRNWDQVVGPLERQFFFMPFMHSESLMMQERAVRLFMTRMPAENKNLLHARAHRKVIRDFGRFPYRNAPMGRFTTPREQSFLEAGGYAEAVRSVGG